MFTSKSSRPATSGSTPGPGAYSVSPKSISNASAFGTTPKNLPLSKDPHRPVLVGYNEIPAVGSYKIKEDFERSGKLKIKFITGGVASKNAPFNITEKRDIASMPKVEVPGPGNYSISTLNEKKGSLPCKSLAGRFEKDKSPDYPGPGTYDTLTNLNDRGSPFFTSKTPRFMDKNHKTPEPYVSHQDWGKKETRANDAKYLNQRLCFDSSEPRFIEKQKDNLSLGPGYYNDDRPSTVISGALSTTERFKGFGNYRPKTGTNEYIGPGYYNAPVSKKKSFNMAKELNNEKLWLM